jgi:hypothetical protein
MRTSERKSLWYHSAFSAVLCALMIGLVVIKHDVPSLIVALLVAIYVAGNTWLHLRRHDFRTETLYEYLLLATAVLIVLWGAVRH